MATPITIKYSTGTAAPGSLSNGELAFTANGNVLYIGSAGAVTAIGIARNPGVLTANQALVANSTSYLDVIKTANLYIGSVTVNVINAIANSTVLGAAGNNELTSTWAIKTYVDAKVAAGGAVAGSNTNIQFNDSSSPGGSAGFTFDKTTNVVAISNTLNIGANVLLDTTKLFIGNSTVNTNILLTGATFANSTVSSAYGPNATIGANVTLSTTGLFVGNSTVNATLSANGLNSGSTVIGQSSISVTDITVTGNLTVSGALAVLNATNLAVTDSMIKLANGQSTADALSIGQYGVYGNSTVTQFAGLFRDQSNGAVWTLFNTQKEPTTTVDTSNNTYSIGTLFAKLSSYGLVSNGTNLNLTANSTLAVAITANTLSLTTQLPVSSGGTGLNTITASAVMVGNGTGPVTLVSGTDGLVMASVSGVPTFVAIDGGTF